MKINEGFLSFQDIASRIKPKKKIYPFQEVCSDLSKLSGLKYGVILAIWRKKGNEIFQMRSKIKQGEIKNVQAFLMSQLKQ
jgi:hypothetical protein